VLHSHLTPHTVFRPAPISSVTTDCQHTLDYPHVTTTGKGNILLFSKYIRTLGGKPALPAFFLVTSCPEKLVLINQGTRRHIPEYPGPNSRGSRYPNTKPYLPRRFLLRKTPYLAGFSLAFHFLLDVFLDAFAKIAKDDYYLRHVCMSFLLGQTRSHWTDSHDIWYLSIFSRICLENSSFIAFCQQQYRYFT
jgi:hypothetical protein